MSVGIDCERWKASILPTTIFAVFSKYSQNKPSSKCSNTVSTYFVTHVFWMVLPIEVFFFVRHCRRIILCLCVFVLVYFYFWPTLPASALCSLCLLPVLSLSLKHSLPRRKSNIIIIIAINVIFIHHHHRARKKGLAAKSLPLVCGRIL